MLAYERFGSGEPLVLVHGIAHRRQAWYPVAERLAEHDPDTPVDEDRLLTWHTVGETALPHRASLMLSPAPGDRERIDDPAQEPHKLDARDEAQQQAVASR